MFPSCWGYVGKYSLVFFIKVIELLVSSVFVSPGVYIHYYLLLAAVLGLFPVFEMTGLFCALPVAITS
jgi:hypothetical protein